MAAVNDDEAIESVAALCRQARELLGDRGSFRLRVAIDIAEIECALEIERKRLAGDANDDGSLAGEG